MNRLRLILVLGFAFFMLTPSPAAAQPQPAQWYDGGIQYSTITNCVSIIQGFQYQENGAGTFVGFYGQPTSSLPAPNTTYYIHVYVAGLGNSCSGQRFFADVSLPPNTALAIDGINPVKCYTHLGQVTGPDCPQILPASPYNAGAFALYSTDSAHANLWPLPQGGHWEFLIPVRSTTTLTSAPLQANVWMFDGNSSPWLRPTQGVYVFAAGAPTILYPSPSTITIGTTTALSQAYLYTNSTTMTGTGVFELGLTTGYGLITDNATVPGGYSAYLATDNWVPPGLQPDTLYHWRFKFTPTGSGTTYYGADQTFRTLPDGKQTVGTGSAGSCDEAAFTAKFNIAGTKQIVFDCGTLPVTIPFTTTRTISTPTFTTLLIDGGGKVTLQRSGSGNHFAVTSGATLTLKGITLTNGAATCGGAVNVSSGASLILDDARFLNNQAFAQGGAVCNNGTTTATNALFSGNQAGNHGGAIGNYNTLTVTNSKFLNNNAPVNGGAIDSVGSLTVTGSTFAANAAGFRGGGINSFVGTLLSISNSSFLTNTAGAYGGGVASDGPATTSIVGSTFSANSSNGHGGAIQMSGTTSFTLTNSTLTDNTAVTEGGGLYWTAGQTVAITITNSTIADNVARTTGGNIYTGGAPPNTYITMKNSIVSGGSPGNCSGTVQSTGYNLESANTCGFGGTGDKPNVAANLGPLLKNAGTTMTRLPLPGSQAIDGGTNTGCPATDQQGVTRTRDGDGNGSSICDIGATELLFPAATITRISPDGGPIAGGQVITITGTNLSGATVTIGGIASFVGASTATTATVLTPAHAAGPVNVVVTGAFGSATATNGYTYFPLVGPPTITATATSSTDVALSWPASSGAVSYEIWRSSQGGAFNQVLSTTSTSINDTLLTADTTYLYKVRAVNGANMSGFSLADAATTVIFTDPGSLVGLPIKAVHLTQLRTAINAMTVAAGLDAKFFTNGTVSVGSTAVRRLHFVELRAALNIARSALGLATLAFTDPTLSGGATTIKGIHVSEMRAGTQ